MKLQLKNIESNGKIKTNKLIFISFSKLNKKSGQFKSPAFHSIVKYYLTSSKSTSVTSFSFFV
ncbi:MAG: hypothetical protein A2W98_07575 [Bacteroidetes bacterium GWF2_33_38]|nr:MAG: hypothetical protein A2W98_07575 [Bacteroidetes bacterium GWF2_33_38]